MKLDKKPYRYISNGAIMRKWSGARADHRTEPGQQPAPRALHWRVKSGTWAGKPRSNHDQHKRRAHLRREQKQTRQWERAHLQAQLESQQ